MGTVRTEQMRSTGFPENFESLSELEALREAVGDEMAYWAERVHQYGRQAPEGIQASTVLGEWATIRRNMLSDGTYQLTIVASALRAARAAREVPGETA